MGVEPADLARALIRRRKAELEENGRRARAVRHHVEAEACALVADGWARRAWLIGSLAWGDFGIGSDADIVFEGLGSDRTGAAAARLSAAAEVEVDVLRLEDLPESFRERVVTEGIELVP